jgi:tetratricopeptide (TPR) repeat protein
MRLDLDTAMTLSRGIEHSRNNRFREAIADYDRVLAASPDNGYAVWNRAIALLSLGAYAEGFRQHELGLKLFHSRGFGPVRDAIDRLTAALPLWRGEPGRLLLYHELGFGDAIQTFRFLPELKRHAELTLVVDPVLVRLAQRFEIEVVTRVPDDLTAFDARLPLFSVMTALDQILASIPAAPYLTVPWRFGGGRIGIAWSGRTQTEFSLEQFCGGLEHQGFSLHSLQPGATNDQVQALPDGDFADLQQRIAEMDHIVTVDTACAHLAGAMGHPSAHLLLPHLMDWRWWHAKNWYPTLNTYRQTTPQDWSAPFARLNEHLTGKR